MMLSIILWQSIEPREQTLQLGEQDKDIKCEAIEQQCIIINISNAGAEEISKKQTQN